MTYNKKAVFNKVATESSISFFITLTRFGLVYLINIIIPFAWGIDTLGNFVYFEAILFILIPFSIFGMDRGLVKFLSLKGTQSDDIARFQVSNTAVATLLLNGAILIILLSIHYFTNLLHIEIGMKNFFTIFILSLIPYSLIMIFKGGLEGIKLNSLGIFIREFLFRGVFLVCLAVYFLLNFGESLIFITYPVVMSITSVIMILAFIRKSNIRFSLNSINLIEFLRSPFFKYSLTLIGITIVSMLHFRLDRFMLGLLVERSSLGEYHLVALICGSVAIFLRASNSISGPFFSNFFSIKDFKALEEFYRIITKWTLIGILPAVIISLLYSEKLFNMILGDQYDYLITVFVILMIGHFVTTLLGPANNFMAMTGQEKKLLHINIFFAVISIILMYLLISYYGMVGAAIGTSFYIVFQKLTSFYFSWKKFSIIIFDVDYLYISLLLLIFPIIFFFIPEPNTTILISKMIFSLIFGYIYCWMVLKRSKNDYDQQIIELITTKLQKFSFK